MNGSFMSDEVLPVLPGLLPITLVLVAEERLGSDHLEEIIVELRDIVHPSDPTVIYIYN